MAKPIILFSSLEDDGKNGDARSNGGYKLQTIWGKLLRQHGYEAYRVTRDGTQLPWMIEHIPVISIRAANKMSRLGKPMRVMTTWIVAKPAMNISENLYFYDAELAHTCHANHFVALKKWLPKIKKIGTHSRTQQAWYMATFGITPDYIQEWSDPDYFVPDLAVREVGRVGYMWEGPQTPDHIMQIRDYCAEHDCPVTFYQIGGNEREVITSMQHTDVFLGMNIGKHNLWGEGCPRAPQEAMHCGTVVLAYDVFGNHEYLIDGYTGYMVGRNNPQAMAEKLVQIMRDRPQREAVRARGIDFMEKTFSGGVKKFQEIKEFLDL